MEDKEERTVYLSNLRADIANYIETLSPDTVYLFLSRKSDGHITTTQAYDIIAEAGDMIVERTQEDKVISRQNPDYREG